MKTAIKQLNDAVIVSLEGTINYQDQVPLRDHLLRLTKSMRQDSVPKKIIFNLEHLEFVGSSGISSLIQTLKEFNASVPGRPRYCRVASEFKKIIQAFDDGHEFDFFETDEMES